MLQIQPPVSGDDYMHSFMTRTGFKQALCALRLPPLSGVRQFAHCRQARLALPGWIMKRLWSPKQWKSKPLWVRIALVALISANVYGALSLRGIVRDPNIELAAYLLIMMVCLSLVWAFLRQKTSVIRFALAPCIYTVAAIYAAARCALDPFHFLALLCWAVFPGGVIGLLIAAWFARKRYKVLFVFFSSFAIILLAIAIDAF
jgi:hypothetical protein